MSGVIARVVPASSQLGSDQQIGVSETKKKPTLTPTDVYSIAVYIRSRLINSGSIWFALVCLGLADVVFADVAGILVASVLLSQAFLFLWL